jgi:hypothetical protein
MEDDGIVGTTASSPTLKTMLAVGAVVSSPTPEQDDATLGVVGRRPSLKRWGRCDTSLLGQQGRLVVMPGQRGRLVAVAAGDTRVGRRREDGIASTSHGRHGASASNQRRTLCRRRGSAANDTWVGWHDDQGSGSRRSDDTVTKAVAVGNASRTTARVERKFEPYMRPRGPR